MDVWYSKFAKLSLGVPRKYPVPYDISRQMYSVYFFYNEINVVFRQHIINIRHIVLYQLNKALIYRKVDLSKL